MITNRILKNDYWEKRIRDKMGVDDAYLPDDLLNSPDIITLAEANIIEKISDYATLDGDLRVYLEYAVVLECCILLCPSMGARLPKKETGPHGSYELGSDWNKRKAVKCRNTIRSNFFKNFTNKSVSIFFKFSFSFAPIAS